MRRKVIGTTAPFMESLESREMFSVAPAAVTAPVEASTVLHPASSHVHKTATLIKFTLTASTTMGQTIFFTGRVRNPDGSPVTGGTVSFIEGTSVIATGTVSHRGYCTITIYNAFAGKYTFHCQYDGTRRLLPAVSASASVTVAAPTFTTTGDSLGEFTAVTGTGPTTVTGSHVNVEYSEYLANGTFIGSTVGSTPLAAVVGTNLITGFSEGITGMQAGTVRVLNIPPSIGYGSNPPSGIPTNTNLIFIVKMISFT